MIRVVNLYNEKYDVYIGRAGRGKDGKWGNKFDSPDRDKNIADFEHWLLTDPKGKKLMKDLPELLGKRLGCFCKPKACHGDVLKKHAELMEEKDART